MSVLLSFPELERPVVFTDFADFDFPFLEAEADFFEDLEVGDPTDFFFTAFFATTDAT
ncbi:hypothetical protein [Leptospira kmetyi]|uniref:hypothetical protein n=1 Tax=Leptospira kmetyi TaxID=408139 RepID=UPI001F0CB4E9|nr:hypothetical protein [Leptospira kmetyi]